MYQHIYFFDDLANQQHLIDHLSQSQSLPPLSALVDGRDLSCPMPLLKAKIALKKLNTNEHLYLVASDKNATTDLTAFCKKNNFQLQSWCAKTNPNKPTQDLFHFIITKTQQTP